MKDSSLKEKVFRNITKLFFKCLYNWSRQKYSLDLAAFIFAAIFLNALRSLDLTAWSNSWSLAMNQMFMCPQATVLFNHFYSSLVRWPFHSDQFSSATNGLHFHYILRSQTKPQQYLSSVHSQNGRDIEVVQEFKSRENLYTVHLAVYKVNSQERNRFYDVTSRWSRISENDVTILREGGEKACRAGYRIETSRGCKCWEERTRTPSKIKILSVAIQLRNSIWVCEEIRSICAIE